MTAQSLPEPLAQGDLGRTPFAHLLLYVQQRALNGTLVIWKPVSGEARPLQDRLRIEGGVPVAGRLSEPASRLERGMLPLFARADGPYAFYEDVDLVGASEQVRSGRVDVLPLIAASLRGSSRDDVVGQVVRGFGDAKLRFNSGVNLDRFGLLPEERACVQLLRAEPMSVRKLCEISPLDPRMVQRLVYLLALTKSIEPWDEAAAAQQPKRAPKPKSDGPPKKKKRRAGGEPEPPPAPPSGLSSEHRELWQEIGERYLAIDTQNYYDMLGVPRDAPASAIQKAYFNLVKKWHPDRVPSELSEMRPYVEAIFGHLTRANETLTDDEQRGKYLAAVQDGGGTPAADRQLAQIVQAAMDFRKVEVMMRRREWDEALKLTDEVLALNDEEPDYHATRGWVLFQKSGGADGSRFEVEREIDRALELNDKHDKAHYYKGMVLKKAGKRAEALEHFRKAAEANPKNIDAVREVRIAEMRSDRPDEPKAKKKEAGGDSLFGKLFGGKKK